LNAVAWHGAHWRRQALPLHRLRIEADPDAAVLVDAKPQAARGAVSAPTFAIHALFSFCAE
jgi:hypothetical protein